MSLEVIAETNWPGELRPVSRWSSMPRRTPAPAGIVANKGENGMKPKTFHKVFQTRTAKKIDEIMEELCFFLYIWMHVTLLLRLITGLSRSLGVRT